MNDIDQLPILIISGDLSQSRVIHSCLEKAGFRVVDVSRGENILNMLNQVKPQLALLDWNLPDLSALEVARSIRASRRFEQLPIILTGREISSENKIRSLESGIDICIEGAVFPRELIARVRALLRRVKTPH
jgi:two-component system, OmpR family, phosphate regulon response regulator PhoB